MTDSIQIHRKKASFILAVSVTSYSVIATYLYSCHQIDLMEYTTPIILTIVFLILSCAFSQRFFYRYLIKNNVCISFGKQKESIPPEITQPSDTITAEVEVIEVPTARNDYTNGYDERIAEIEREKAEQQADIMRVMHEYTTYSMAEFLSKDDLITLHENIKCFAHGQCDLYKPIRSKYDNPLNTLDIRHFVWNIGIRLNISVEKCAEFIKTIFPHELKNATLFYLSKNLRTTGICKIPLDIPLKGEYYFNCLKKTDDETAVLTD